MLAHYRINPRTSRSFILDTDAQRVQDYSCGSLCPHFVGKRNASGIQMMVRSSTRSRGLTFDSSATPFSCLPSREKQRSIMGNCGSLQRQLQLSMRLLIWSIFNFWHLPSEGLQKRKEMGKIYLPCRGDIGRGWLYIWIPTRSSLDDKTAQSILSLCNLSWAASLAHMGHNVCTNLYLSTLCKK